MLVGRLPTTRCTTDVPTPSVRPILSMPMPAAPQLADAVLDSEGGPWSARFTPFAWPAPSRHSPAHGIIDRSNSANTPHNLEHRRPEGVLVSSAC